MTLGPPSFHPAAQPEEEEEVSSLGKPEAGRMPEGTGLSHSHSETRSQLPLFEDLPECWQSVFSRQEMGVLFLTE